MTRNINWYIKMPKFLTYSVKDLPRRLPPRRSKYIFFGQIINPTGPFQDQQHKQKETHQPNLTRSIHTMTIIKRMMFEYIEI